MKEKTAVALSIAGSDPSGGAGIQADLKTFSALGVYGATVITALTAQNTTGVTGIHIPPVDFLKQQLLAVLSDLNVKAIKIGMLADEHIIEAVVHLLDKHYNGPVIVDPVMVATSGDRLLKAEAENAVREQLLPIAALITPNIPEAACLLKAEQAVDKITMMNQLDNLLALGPAAVLLKGGHGSGENAVDYLKLRTGEALELTAKRIETRNTHGTGCTLSAAICAYIIKGQDLETAVRSAKSYLTESLKRADTLNIGSGSGPVQHFHNC